MENNMVENASARGTSLKKGLKDNEGTLSHFASDAGNQITSKAGDLSRKIVSSAKSLSNRHNELVRSSPTAAVGIALASGLAFGSLAAFLMMRKGSKAAAWTQE